MDRHAAANVTLGVAGATDPTLRISVMHVVGLAGGAADDTPSVD